ncbi:MAG TPA: FGGY family carbohydrate kinase [Caulobacteraceae bacterium]|nr:FGGY family carbohydrate kinase [Caulobacteraceae bacterium]
MAERLLALDVGTTAVKAALFEPDGRLLGLTRARLSTRTPAPGLAEQDAHGVWCAARRLVRQLLAQTGRPAGDIAALGLATQRASLVVWDKESGRPLAPMALWSDLRGAGRAAELGAQGFFVVPQHAAAKLEMVLATIPDAKRLMAADRLAIGGIDSFLIWKLSGGAAHVTDRSQAWPSGWLDLFALDWNRALIAAQGLPEAVLPRLVDTFGDIATVDPAHLGAPIPISATIADQQAAFVAHEAPAKITFGTAAAVDAGASDTPTLASAALPPFIVASAGGRTRYCIEGMVISAGAALDWLARALALGSASRVSALAAGVPDAAGAAFLPALQGLGARAPDPSRRGALAGLSPGVARSHLARAGLEGVAFRVRDIVEALAAATGPIATIGADGGLAASETFLQIQADVLARPVRRHALVEATAAGAALLAGRAAGVLSEADASPFRRYDRTFEPHISADEAAARYDRWRALVFP